MYEILGNIDEDILSFTKTDKTNNIINKIDSKKIETDNIWIL